MQIALGAAIGALLVALVLLIARRPGRAVAPAPVPDPGQLDSRIGSAVNSALAQALQALDDRSRADRQESIQLAVERLEPSLRALNQALGDLREGSTRQFGEMSKAVTMLAQRTDNLKEVLSSSQARGQWGERLAEDMLRAAGFIEGKNYRKQKSIDGGGRPDYRFEMPPDRVLFMDVKFPLDKYAEYVEATDDSQRAAAGKAFVSAVRGHIDGLARRDYVDKSADQTIDYVLLFVPNESISNFVHSIDAGLIDYAIGKKVVLCSPLNLYAFLSVVRQATDSFHTERTAAKIVQLINQFQKQWGEYVTAVATVQKDFNKLQGDLESIVPGGTRFRKLEIPVEKIEKVRRNEGIPELDAGDAGDDQADGDD